MSQRTMCRFCCALLSHAMIFSTAAADEVQFAIENNAWDGNPNLGTYAPASGALIDFELFISIEDVESDGPDSQGLAGFSGDLLTNTGIVQPVLDFSPTNLNTAYLYFITDPHFARFSHLPPQLGFGMGFASDQGNNQAQTGDVLGAGAFMPLDWDADYHTAAGLQPYSLSGIGFGVPSEAVDSGGNAFYPAYGDIRARWYLLRGQISVPGAPGDYLVDFAPNAVNLIRAGLDLRQDITAGYVEDAFVTHTVTHTGFSFRVVPEPATFILMLGIGAAATYRRRSEAH